MKYGSVTGEAGDVLQGQTRCLQLPCRQQPVKALYRWWACCLCRLHLSEPMGTSWCRYCRTIAAELLSRLALDTEHRQIIESAHAVKPLCDMLGMRTPQQVTFPSSPSVCIMQEHLLVAGWSLPARPAVLSRGRPECCSCSMWPQPTPVLQPADQHPVPQRPIATIHPTISIGRCQTQCLSSGPIAASSPLLDALL